MRRNGASRSRQSGGIVPRVILFFLMACASGPDEPSTVPTTLETPGYSMSLAWDPLPPATGNQELRLTIEPDPSSVEVDLFMPAHGHGLANDPTMVGSDGVYDVSFVWPMAGEWQLTVTLDGSESETAVVNVPVE
jgi:hypothetical protein